MGLVPAGAQQMKSSPASVSSPDQITLDTDCWTYKPQGGLITANATCEVLKGQLLDKQNACIAELVKFKTISPKEFEALGKVTRDNACAMASRIPKRAADLR